MAMRKSKTLSFSERCYKVLLKVPRGKLTTYSDIAHALGSRAYRAVGNAMNKNPYAPKVPCHRVVGKDGSLTGFFSGLKKKEALLKSEGIEIRNGKVVDLDRYLFNLKP